MRNGEGKSCWSRAVAIIVWCGDGEVVEWYATLTLLVGRSWCNTFIFKECFITARHQEAMFSTRCLIFMHDKISSSTTYPPWETELSSLYTTSDNTSAYSHRCRDSKGQKVGSREYQRCAPMKRAEDFGDMKNQGEQNEDGMRQGLKIGRLVVSAAADNAV